MMKKVFFIAMLCICAAVIIVSANQTNQTAQANQNKEQNAANLPSADNETEQIEFEKGHEQQYDIKVSRDQVNETSEKTAEQGYEFEEGYEKYDIEISHDPANETAETDKQKDGAEDTTQPIYEFEEGHEQQYDIKIDPDNQ